MRILTGLKKSTPKEYSKKVFLHGLLSIGILMFFGSSLWAADVQVQHHNLDMTLDPSQHSLIARDTLRLNGVGSVSSPIRFVLNRTLTVQEVRLEEQRISFNAKVLETIQGEKPDRSTIETSFPHEQPEYIVEIHLPNWAAELDPLDLTIIYQGKVYDPPRASPGLRFVKPDETTGHIGPEGVYLTFETQWYPDIPGSLATYHIQVTVPDKWETVTQGREVSRSLDQDQLTTEWEVKSKSEALTLVANRFVKSHRNWNGVEIATYLFPEDAHLAGQYLDATAHYLDVYTKLLGPYPFPKFAVVENFFPSGIGLPSYTLLGSRVIKRGYTQPYSLGHEIVHSWFGNSVLNDFRKGNWVEGLTTYLSNYYYEELSEPIEHVIKNRRRMVFEYSLFAVPPDEYPLLEFHHKKTRVDNAIGYQKAAMVFHMLRREIGDQAFFSGVHSIVEGWSGTYTEWGTLEHVFEKASGQDLRWFFKQWVEWPGAPSIRILETQVLEEADSAGRFVIHLKIAQQEPPYRLRLPVIVDLTSGKTHTTTILFEAETPVHVVTVSLPARPTRLAIDPNFETFRRLSRAQIPPMLNLWTTDRNRAIVLHKDGSEEEQTSFQPILQRIRSQGSSVVQKTDEKADLGEESILILGGPETNRLASKAIEGCGDTVKLEHNRALIRDQIFEGPEIALLVSCPNLAYPGHVSTVFYGFSPKAVAQVARLLFFYGWDSYLVFQNGHVVARGMYEGQVKDLEVQLDTA